MTTTNQAFIKVYRHDAAESALSHLETAEDRATAAALSASIEIVAATTHFQSRSSAQPASGGGLFATSIDVVPPPAQAAETFPFFFKAGLGERRDTTPQRRVAPRRIDTPSTKRPLSAFLARHQLPNAVATKQRQVPARAGTTVESFRWPAVCANIAQQSATELNGLADLVLEQLAQGRSLFGLLGLFAGVGCTTTTLCLASQLAGRDRKSVLVDGDFYSHQLATRLGVVPTVGWQEVLEEAAPLADAIIHAQDDQLDALVLSGKRPFDPLELAASTSAARTAEYLRQRYDLALVDLGSFFDPRSQPVALELVRNMRIDAVIAVTDSRHVDPRDLATVEDHLSQRGCELLGVIENRTTR